MPVESHIAACQLRRLHTISFADAVIMFTLIYNHKQHAVLSLIPNSTQADEATPFYMVDCFLEPKYRHPICMHVWGTPSTIKYGSPNHHHEKVAYGSIAL